MILWFIVGFMVWILCVLFMLAIIKGECSICRNGYEQKLYYSSMVNAQNIKDSTVKEVNKATKARMNHGLPVTIYN